MGIFVIIIIISGLVVYFITESDRKQLIEREKNSRNLLDSNIKIMIYGNDFSEHIALTSKNEVYVMNQDLTRKYKIDINRIIDIKIDLQVREKNVVRVVSLVPGYDKHTLVDKVSLKILFSNGSVKVITYTPQGKNLNTEEVQTKLDKMNRFKSIISHLKNKDLNRQYDEKNKSHLNNEILIKHKADELKIFKELLESDIITKEEFDKRKNEFMDICDKTKESSSSKKNKIEKNLVLKKTEKDEIISNAKNLKELTGDDKKIISVIDNEKIYLRGYKKIKTKLINPSDIKSIKIILIDKANLKDIYIKYKNYFNSDKEVGSIQFHLFVKEYNEIKKCKIYRVPKDRSIGCEEVQSIIREFEEFKMSIERLA